MTKINIKTVALLRAEKEKLMRKIKPKPQAQKGSRRKLFEKKPAQ